MIADPGELPRLKPELQVFIASLLENAEVPVLGASRGPVGSVIHQLFAQAQKVSKLLWWTRPMVSQPWADPGKPHHPDPGKRHSAPQFVRPLSVGLLHLSRSWIQFPRNSFGAIARFNPKSFRKSQFEPRCSVGKTLTNLCSLTLSCSM